MRDIKDPRVRQGIVSVTGVDTTIDLRKAKVYLSVYGLKSEKEFLQGLKSASGHLRSELARSLGLRYTPELAFGLDKSIERGSRINTLLGSLDAGSPPGAHYEPGAGNAPGADGMPEAGRAPEAGRVPGDCENDDYDD